MFICLFLSVCFAASVWRSKGSTICNRNNVYNMNETTAFLHQMTAYRQKT